MNPDHPNGHEHEPVTAEVIPIKDWTINTYASTQPVQRGSKIAFAVLPAGFEVEEATDENGQRWFIYTIDSVFGLIRVAFSEFSSKAHLDRLAELHNKPKLEVARQMPPGM